MAGRDAEEQAVRAPACWAGGLGSVSVRCVVFAGLLLSMVACDNSFEPIADEQTDFFALFGFLDTSADTQFVRVNPLRETLESSGETGEVKVSSLHLRTGAYVTWQDSLIRLDDGRPGLLFYAVLPVAPGDAFLLEVQGGPGEVTQASTQVPSPVRLDSGPLGLDFNRKLSQRVTLLDQKALPRDLRLRYEVVPPGEIDPVPFTFPVLESGFPTSRGLEVVVPLESDRGEILRRLGVPQIDSTVVLQSHRPGDRGAQRRVAGAGGIREY